MIIKTRFTGKEYAALMLSLIYRRPFVIFLSALGLYSLIILVLYCVGIRLPFVTYDNLSIPCGLAIAIPLFPLLGYRQFIKTFNSNKLLAEEITYEFTNDLIKSSGSSFQSEREWTSTRKVRELKGWFMIYQSDTIASLIPKKCMTDEQVIELRNIIRSYPSIKAKLRR